MGEEIGERGSRKSPDGFSCYFLGFGGFLTVGTEESIKNHPEATTQIPKSPKYHTGGTVEGNKNGASSVEDDIG